jgi:pyruvate/2-oxoglutarate dehydrogenase complex dihydrolipoamide dehydrogenase (E3) component
VGWAENEAARSEIEFKVVSGSMRLVSDDDRSVSGSRRLLGCLVVGDHAAVIANIASIAIRLETPIDQLRDIPLALWSMCTERQLRRQLGEALGDDYRVRKFTPAPAQVAPK